MEQIDYKKLLEKYIIHVEESEGTDFIRNIAYKHSNIEFTEKEWYILLEISIRVNEK